MAESSTAVPPEQRQRTARVLAAASQQELAELWHSWPQKPQVEYLRGPESGLVMVQGRVGGTGDRFNLGEATVTRATVTLNAEGEESTGTAYVLGSYPEHAGLAAIFDALLNSSQRKRAMAEIITVLEQRQNTREAARRADARSTVVDFFTVARENDGGEGDQDE
ncbi:phosphonate C-P lyase system protein PhnG [Nesterenkonia ebinurensis]|uniref:phosphonate C-P lyase system protein PhnG n=1 Tax=Nesterenkonia ebinurensis TaxID=2608252 RepID=UPI00123DB140|nr:phosphonate C-P lyase system protein PhnG [Nesterenkonia ebinurensis]